MLNGMPESFQDKVILAFITFALTTVLGAVWAFVFTTFAWKRQTRMELHRQRYTEGAKFLDDLSLLIGQRFFLMQRLLWSLQHPDPDKIRERELKYFEAVDEWNSKYWLNRNKIRLLVSREYAERFLSYRDESRQNDPQSLHYQFVQAHRAVMRAKDVPKSYAAAASLVAKLNVRCSNFLEQLTSEFLRRATHLQLLEVPPFPEERKVNTV